MIQYKSITITQSCVNALHKKATIHQVTTMLPTSKNSNSNTLFSKCNTNVLFPIHNQLLTTGTDNPSLNGTLAIIKVKGHQYCCWALWLWPGNRTFYLVDSGFFARWWVLLLLSGSQKNAQKWTRIHCWYEEGHMYEYVWNMTWHKCMK